MTHLRLLARIAGILWRSGLFRLSPGEIVAVLGAIWRCGVSYAALAVVAGRRFPQAVALVDEDGPLTFAELLEQSEALAATLLQEGLQRGQPAALISRNHRGFAVGLLGLSRVGVDVLVLSPDSPVAPLQRILDRQPVAVVLHDAELGALLAAAAPAVKRRSLGEAAPAVAAGRLPRLRRAGNIVVLTSGSTGVPKGIRRRPSLASLLPTLAGLLEAMPVELHRPAVLAIPLSHGYGLATLAISLAMGSPLHVARRFDIAPLVARLREGARAVLLTVPTLLQRWLRDAAPMLPGQLAVIVSGSAPLEAGLCRRVLERCGPILFNLYGSTEGGIMAMATPQELSSAPGAVGRPLPGTALRLLDAAGQPVTGDGLGRILVSGPLVLRPDESGWFDTGDLGRVDGQGLLHVCGRSDTMFVSGGENVYPEATERVLLEEPALLDAAVTVAPDPEFGHRMIAWVVPKPSAALDVGALRERLRASLERYQVPRSIHPVAQIPRNALGKVDRKALATLPEPAAD